MLCSTPVKPGEAVSGREVERRGESSLAGDLEEGHNDLDLVGDVGFVSQVLAHSLLLIFERLGAIVARVDRVELGHLFAESRSQSEIRAGGGDDADANLSFLAAPQCITACLFRNIACATDSSQQKSRE